MALNEAQTQLAEKIGKLLAESPLDESIKSSLLGKMEQIPESLLFKLLDALELENEELEKTAFEIDLFLKEQDKDWKKVVEEQKKVAVDLTDQWVEKLKV